MPLRHIHHLSSAAAAATVRIVAQVPPRRPPAPPPRLPQAVPPFASTPPPPRRRLLFHAATGSVPDIGLTSPASGPARAGPPDPPGMRCRRFPTGPLPAVVTGTRSGPQPL